MIMDIRTSLDNLTGFFVFKVCVFFFLRLFCCNVPLHVLSFVMKEQIFTDLY